MNLSEKIKIHIENKLTAHFMDGGIFIDIISGDIQKEMGISSGKAFQVCGAMRKIERKQPYNVLRRPPSDNSIQRIVRYYKDEIAKATDGIIETIVGKPKDISQRVERKSKLNLPRPSVVEVQAYLNLWDKLDNYVKQEKALSKLFHITYPKNNSIDEVLIKACALNAFYSTNIRNIFPVAEHIVRLNIDNRLVSGDLNLVSEVAKVDDKSNNNYSFATKYCSHHFADKYPIYDSFVHKVLVHFRKQDGFLDFKDDDLKNFDIFHKSILAFRKFYGLEVFTIKEIDRYLWQLGKKFFPKTYGKKRGDE